MQLQLWQALVLGAIQGVSELFPVSSLAQVILIPALLHWDFDQKAQKFLAFVVALHLATAIALVIYFWRDWMVVVKAYLGSIQRQKLVYDDASKFAWLLVAGTIIVGLVGLILEKKLRSFFEDPRYFWAVAVILIANGGVMLLGDFLKKRSETPSFEPEGDLTVGGALSSPNAGATAGGAAVVDAKPRRMAHEMSFLEGAIVGGTQTLALLPGISRSGVTIVGGLLAGLTYEEASRFSFMLATPVILLAAIKKVPELFKSPDILSYTIPSALLSGITAYLSVAFLMRYFKHNRLAPFGYYCVGFGTLALVLLKMH
jgi:undecaprenyl-diphosphatase